MAALLGDPERPIEEICAEASAAAGTVVPANFNAPGQTVISGEVAGVDLALDLAKQAGAKRGIKLNVSGAFHSPLMQPAADGLAAALAAAPMRPAAFPVFANVDASATTEPDAARALLVRQLTAPVRWTDVVAALAARFPAALYVELGPGSVLRGLVRKIAPQAEVTSCGTADDVDKLMERLA
jgi:[acyl-carrier-protein] S-malonyltransferase